VTTSPGLLVASTLALVLVACGGGGGGGGELAAAIIVPNDAGARIVPGGELSFAATCPLAGADVTYAWTFPGGAPSTSEAAAPGRVAFAVAGSYEVTFRCSDGRTTFQSTRTVSVAEPGPSQFAVQLQYLQSSTEQAYSADFQWAADRLATLIQGPVPGMHLDEQTDADCGNTHITSETGELLVLASVEPMDGASGTLALSGPCIVRTSDGLPVLGIIRIDSADAPLLSASGMLRMVILHEMFHVLGFGSLWGPRSEHGFEVISGAGGSDPFFTGAQARASFRDFNGGSSYQGTPVPVENAGGTASRDHHWRTSVFQDELMVAVMGSSPPPLSRTTLESLADLGWEVNAGATAVDPSYTIATAGSNALRSASEAVIDLGSDVLPLTLQER